MTASHIKISKKEKCHHMITLMVVERPSETSWDKYCRCILSSDLVQGRKIVLLFASTGVTAVLLLVPETRCSVMNLGNKSALRTEVNVTLALEVTALIVLEDKFGMLQ